MDEIPSSPPLYPFSRALSPTSSEPPLFSSDDGPDAADITNYESPRAKRKRAEPWWEHTPIQKERKKTKMSRNFDSGVWLPSEDTLASDPALPAVSLAMSAAETRLRVIMHDTVERGDTNFHLEGLQLQASDLDCISQLNSVIQAPLSVDTDVPAEGQYRSLVPKLYVNLSSNRLSTLPGALFDVRFISSLILRGNDIAELPPSIGNMPYLRELDISNNRLRFLPRELLEQFPQDGMNRGGQLSQLTVFGNPLLKPHLGCEVDPISRVFDRDPSFAEHFTTAPQPVLIARTPVEYHDQTGRVVKGSPALPGLGGEMVEMLAGSPEVETSKVDVLTDAPHSAFYVPPTWFEPPTRSRVPSLFTRALQFALETETPKSIRQKLGETVPPLADAMLSCAEENLASINTPLRSCHTCGKAYIVPAAEWIEFWTNYIMWDSLPFRVRVCSWGCVPDAFARRPTALEVPHSV